MFSQTPARENSKVEIRLKTEEDGKQERVNMERSTAGGKKKKFQWPNFSLAVPSGLLFPLAVAELPK